MGSNRLNPDLVRRAHDSVLEYHHAYEHDADQSQDNQYLAPEVTEESEHPRETSNNQGERRRVRWGASQFYEISPRPQNKELPAADDESTSPSSESSQESNASDDYVDNPYDPLPRRHPEKFYEEPEPPEEEVHRPLRASQIGADRLHWQYPVENNYEQERRTPPDEDIRSHRRSRHSRESQRPEKPKKQRRPRTTSRVPQQNPREPEEPWYGEEQPMAEDPELPPVRWLGPESELSRKVLRRQKQGDHLNQEMEDPEPPRVRRFSRASEQSHKAPQRRQQGGDDLHQEIDQTIDWMQQQDDDDHYHWHYHQPYPQYNSGENHNDRQHQASSSAQQIDKERLAARFERRRPAPRRVQSHPPPQVPRAPTPPTSAGHGASASHWRRASTTMDTLNSGAPFATPSYANGHSSHSAAPAPDDGTLGRVPGAQRRMSLADGLAVLNEQYYDRPRRPADISSTTVEIHQDPPPRRRHSEHHRPKKSIRRKFMKAIGLS
ncbi:hypothetical protein F4776DRAFT_527948 [Hypoxylon sp. NC0597]|nr:hypothetical protein F4776DRAFT_527948 [Hypoxylon sp. NC0597]